MKLSRFASGWSLFAAAQLAVRLACLPLNHVEGKAILGIDLGSLYMKVALVQRGAPLEIVTNLHSKRKTENMILFDQGARFYGADASSLLARKPQLTPISMSVMLGRDDEHPSVKVLSDRYYPITPQYNESRSGTYVSVSDASYTPEELVAMVLSHAKEMTQAYAHEQGAVGSTAAVGTRDCVMTVPAHATIHERRALLDAGALADFNVLGLLEENTAAAVQFAMDKVYEDPQILVFYNLGASACQVSVVKVHSYTMKGGGTSSSKTKENLVGSIEVLGKAWDSTVGGQEFDARIVNFLADEFNKLWDKARGDGKQKDIREKARPMTKLRLQANKVKHVLSANTEIPVYMESLFDDVTLSTHLTRAHFEELCHDLIQRTIDPVHKALKNANVTLEEISGIELIGGGMRIPVIQSELKKALGDMELGMHINADESMALGASFHGANVSTAFRVRHVGLTDINPFPITITVKDLAVEEEEEKKGGFFGGGGKKKKKDEDEAEGDGKDEPWGKHATIFKSSGRLGVKKTIAFTHDRDVHCALDYEDTEEIPEGTNLAIEQYNITGVSEFAAEMEEKGLGKPKVSLQFELSLSGITRLIKAEAAVEELYTVEEEVEVDDDEAEEEEDATEEEAKETEESKEEEKKEDKEAGSEDAETSGDNATETTEDSEDKNDTKKEEKKKKKKKKTIKVEKEKKRTHRKSLAVKVYQLGKVQPLSEELLEESKEKLADLAKKDRERVQLEEARNQVESYVYFIRNKLSDDEEEIAKVSTEEQREEVLKLAEDTEEWMYDDYDLETTQAKHKEISEPLEKILFRVKERTERPAAILTLQEKLTKVKELLVKWETEKPQVTEEERSDVMTKVEKVEEWIKEKEDAQSELEPHEDPAFKSKDVPKQMKPVEQLLTRLNRKPKPKVEKKNETEDVNATDANETETVELDPEEDVDVDADADAADADADADADAGADADADAGSDSADEKKADGDEL